jgi:DNA polymerase-1|tara:strand:- start:1289 stop:2107 length:819 start_codon:yes stop_codon:yes gene_type:complete
MAISFNDQRKTGTLVVDALNLAFRWKHAGRSDFRYDYIKTVQSFADSYKCKDIIITADGGASSYRKGIRSDYKGNRKEKYATQTEEEKIAFEEFFEEYQATLDMIEWPVLQYAGVEADDIAAHLVKNKEEFGFENMWLISSDRDWDLLIQEGVNRFSYVNRKEVTINNWYDHYEVTPEEFISLKCLTGDKGDNVPGIPGIGPKRAYGLIKEYGDAFSIYDAAPIAGKYKYIESLNENYEQILQNYELMDLITYCDEAIGKNNVAEIKERFAC